MIWGLGLVSVLLLVVSTWAIGRRRPR